MKGVTRKVMRGIPIAVGLLAGLLPRIGDSLWCAARSGSVIDGDTIEIHGQRIRLDAIDAPEKIQFSPTPPANDIAARQSPRSRSPT